MACGVMGGKQKTFHQQVGRKPVPLPPPPSPLPPNKRFAPRSIVDPCQVPNAALRKVGSCLNGVTAMAFSHNGLYLAAAAAEGNGRFRVGGWMGEG